MELLHLRYFREVASTENITKAAKRLYVSQPALSTAISRLERELDFLLFERKGNRIVLTDAGRCYLEYVNSAFSMLEEGTARAKKIAGDCRNRLRIASGFGVLRGMLNEYRETHPDCDVELRCCDTDKIHSLLANGEADIGLNLGEIVDSRFECRNLMVGRYYAAVNIENPLHSRKWLSLKDMESQLLFCSNIAHTYEIVQDIFQKAGVTCNLLKLDEKDVLFSAAEKGLGSVFCIPMFVENERAFPGGAAERNKIVFIPFADCPVDGCVTMITRRDQHFVAADNDFVSFMEGCFAENQYRLMQDLENRGVPPSSQNKK